MTKLPVEGFFRITCAYHEKGNKWAAGWHTGIDIISDNKKVYSPCKGRINQIGFDKHYGNYVIILDEDGNFHWLCHLEFYYVEIGVKVTYTTLIGKMGKSGNTTGVHLHYEIRLKCNCYNKTMNPAEYIGIENKRGTYHSNNYQLNKQDYKIGQIVSFKVKWTGAQEGMWYLIQVSDIQFWAKNKIQISGTINWIEEDRLQINVNSRYGVKQFWINIKDII